MGYQIDQYERYTGMAFLLVESSDHITGKAGLIAAGHTPTVTIYKHGTAGFAPPAAPGTIRELAGGWYEVAANADNYDVRGPLLLHAEALGADPCDDAFIIVSSVPYAASFPLRLWVSGVASDPTANGEYELLAPTTYNGFPLYASRYGWYVWAGSSSLWTLSTGAGVTTGNYWQHIGHNLLGGFTWEGHGTNPAGTVKVTAYPEPTNTTQIAGYAATASGTVNFDQLNKLTTLASGTVTLVSPVSADNPPILRLVRGDDYNDTTLLPVAFSSTSWPTLSAVTCSALVFYIRRTEANRNQSERYSTLLTLPLDPATNVITDGTLQTITFELTHTQTRNLLVDSGARQFYEILATFTDGSMRTLVTGPVVVTGTVRW